jgi:hypothetical protein
MITLLIVLLSAPPPLDCGGFRLKPGSPAIDAGAWIEAFHCPLPGPAPAGSDCREWYGEAPDIGACEFKPESSIPTHPDNLMIRTGG